jgi:hypothetical protein
VAVALVLLVPHPARNPVKVAVELLLLQPGLLLLVEMEQLTQAAAAAVLMVALQLALVAQV